MSEIEALEPVEAIREIRSLQRFDAALRTRTAGITWMVWGFAIGAVFLSYSIAGAAYGAAFPFWAYLLWVPWTLFAGVATFHLWRSARLVVFFEGRRAAWRGVIATLVALGFIYGAFTLAMALGSLSVGFIAYIGLGSASTAFGLVGFPARDATQRWALGAVGAALVGIGFIANLAIDRDPTDQRILSASLLAALAAALACVAAGAFVARRE